MRSQSDTHIIGVETPGPEDAQAYPRPGSGGSRRIVVKVGSSTLTDRRGALDRRYIATFVDQIANLAAEGWHPVVVTSAAIAAGLEVLGIDRRPDDMPTLQAAASVGQVALVEAYASEFGRRGLSVGQVLLTRNDTAHRGAYLHARDTLERLLSLGAVPVINENDTVSVEEIRFGDNDTLAALVATMIDAERVVMLTDVDGLYEVDPHKNPEAAHLDVVHRVDEHLIACAGPTCTTVGTGGMTTKLKAARVLLKAGIAMVLCDGRRANAIYDGAYGSAGGTVFEPEADNHLSHRKRWIALGGPVAGRILVDDGAVAALQRGGISLLAAGVVEVDGEFPEQSPVAVESRSGELVARGLSSFSASDLRMVAGMRSERLAEVLPDKAGAEVIHADHLVLL